jgi:hypothetical protein
VPAPWVQLELSSRLFEGIIYSNNLFKALKDMTISKKNSIMKKKLFVQV